MLYFLHYLLDFLFPLFVRLWKISIYSLLYDFLMDFCMLIVELHEFNSVLKLFNFSRSMSGSAANTFAYLGEFYNNNQRSRAMMGLITSTLRKIV